jgi:hypothetical protein
VHAGLVVGHPSAAALFVERAGSTTRCLQEVATVQAIQNVTRMSATRRCTTKVTKQRHSYNTRTCQRFHRSTRLPQTLHQVQNILIFSNAPTAGHTSDPTRGNPSCHAAVLTMHSPATHNSTSIHLSAARFGASAARVPSRNGDTNGAARDSESSGSVGGFASAHADQFATHGGAGHPNDGLHHADGHANGGSGNVMLQHSGPPQPGEILP